MKALMWARHFVDITDEEVDIIVETKKSVLIMNGEFWTKKGDANFDVAQGAFDSAEVCDIVGLFLLSELEELNLEASIGKFRDDGLCASSGTANQNEQLKQEISEVYRKHSLSITTNANQNVVQFLDVEFNLNLGTYKPYIKENDVPLYVNKNSNHPPSILKNIPASVNKRISALSSEEKIFESVSEKYENALNKAGHKFKMKFDPEASTTKPKPRCRRRKALYFNPPYSQSVKTNVGAKFLKLIDKHFPKGHILHKVINRNVIKVSYRTTSNLKSIISSHNNKVLRKNENSEEKRMCNCRTPPCPLQGKCLTDNLVYQATVKTDNTDNTYIGLSSPTFKLRLGNHKKDFKNPKYRHSTTLSSFIWDLKDKAAVFELTWKIIGRAQPFSPISGVCNLCTLEKYHLLFTPELATINKRDEIYNFCLHKLPVLLDKT